MASSRPSKRALLRVHHGLVLALWRQKATDAEIAMEVEAIGGGLKVTRTDVFQHRCREGLASWPANRNKKLADVAEPVRALLERGHSNGEVARRLRAKGYSVTRESVHQRRKRWGIKASRPASRRLNPEVRFEAAMLAANGVKCTEVAADYGISVSWVFALRLQMRRRIRKVGKLHDLKDRIAQWAADGMPGPDVIDELLLRYGVEVSDVTLWKFCKKHGIALERKQRLAPEQHLALLKQYHVQRWSYVDIAAFWEITTVSVWKYLWRHECAHPAAARLARRAHQALDRAA